MKVLGIDIGGTNLRGGLVDTKGNITSRKKIYSGADEGINTLISNLVRFIRDFERDEDILSISIGIPGIVDSNKGILTQAPNIRDVENYPLKDVIEKELANSFEVYLENDANCAAVGEYWKGAGKGSGSMVMLTIGTGLGGGLVFGGELWRGEDGMAGEIGHIVIDPEGPLCSCGSHGCLESYVSARALYRMVKNNGELSQYFSGREYHEIPKILMDMADSGNKSAIDLWKDTGFRLGIGLATLVNLLNIEKIIIGGGISNAWHLFIEQAKGELLKRGLRAPAERVEINRGILVDDAGILGAAWLAFRKIGMNL